MAIATSDKNSLVVMDFMRFVSVRLPCRGALLLATHLHLTSNVPRRYSTEIAANASFQAQLRAGLVAFGLQNRDASRLVFGLTEQALEFLLELCEV